MSIHPKVQIQTETGSPCRARWQLPLPPFWWLRPSPTTWTPRWYPSVAGGDILRVSISSPLQGSCSLGKWGLSVRLPMHPTLLGFLPVQPALARSHLLSPLQPPILCCSPVPTLFLSTQLCPFLCCLCQLCYLFPRASWSSPFYLPHHCPPQARRPQASPFACPQCDSLYWDEPTYSPHAEGPCPFL